MLAYRCYFLGDDGKIKGSEIIECPADAAALEEAERRLARGEYPAIEVWEKARRIGTVRYSKDQPRIRARNRETNFDARSPVLST